MECHLWYLSDLSVKVNPDIKSRLAARLLALKNNKKKKKVGSQKLVKPKFPKIGPNTISSTTW